MAWVRRLTSFVFVFIVSALTVWAAKNHHSLEPGERCRYDFQCRPADDGRPAICRGERCAVAE